MPAALLAGFLKGKAQAEQLNEQRALQKEKLAFEKKRLDLEEKDSALKQKMFQDSIQFGQGLSQQLEPTRPAPGAVMPSGEQMPSNIIEQPVNTPPGLGDDLHPLARKLIQGMLQSGNLAGAFQEAAPFIKPEQPMQVSPGGSLVGSRSGKPLYESPGIGPMGPERNAVAFELFGRLPQTPEEFALLNKTIQDRREAVKGEGFPSIDKELIKEADRQGLKGEDRINYLSGKKAGMAAEKTRATEGAKPISAETQQAVTVFDNAKRVAQNLMSEFTPQERAQYVGFLSFPANRLSQIAKEDPKFARFQTLINEAKGQAFGEGGKQLTQFEASVVFGYVPTGRELSTADFEAKLSEANSRADFLRSRRLFYATKSRKELQAMDNPSEVNSGESKSVAPPSDKKAIGYYQMSDGSKQYWDGKSWQKSKP